MIFFSILQVLENTLERLFFDYALATQWGTIFGVFILAVLVGMLSSYYSRTKKESKLWRCPKA